MAERDLARAKQDFSRTWLILGGILAAPTLISLVQHAYDVGLVWYFFDFVEWWRGITRPVVDFIQAPAVALAGLFGWALVIPDFVKDLHALSFVGAGTFSRVSAVSQDADGKAAQALSRVVATFALGVTFLGLILLVYLYGKFCALVMWNMLLFNVNLIPNMFGKKLVAYDWRFVVSILWAVGIPIVSVIAFYIANGVYPRFLH